jgi:anti-sigma factor RsiW
MRCADIDKLVHAYIDGELVGDDCVLLERHTAECERCRARVAFQSSFKGQVRARLRGRVVDPPDRLRRAILDGLDRADARGEGPVPRVWRRALPAGAGVLVAAAGIAVFLGLGGRPSEAESAIVEDAIRGHQKNLPMEVGGPDSDAISVWMQGKVPVPVRPPQLQATRAQLVGARVYHLRNRDVAQIVYRVGRSQMSVYVFDSSGWDLEAPQRQVVRRHPVYLTEERGYTVALYEDRGVGYAFASDLARDELLRLIAASLPDD